MRKIVETRSSLSNTIKDSTIMRIPSQPSIYSGKGVTHYCVSILDSIAKGTSCYYFSHGASLHRHSFSRMLFTLVYIIDDCFGSAVKVTIYRLLINIHNIIGVAFC